MPKILVVDDDPDMLALVRASLEKDGHRVDAETDAAALVQGLDLGADDYIKKPFSIAELRARVNAHLRREVRQPAHTLTRGGVRFCMQEKAAADALLYAAVLSGMVCHYGAAEKHRRHLPGSRCQPTGGAFSGRRQRGAFAG